MAVAQDKIRPTVTIRKDLHALLKTDADTSGRSLSEQIAEVLTVYYEQQGRYLRHVKQKKN